jgi:hypothetical protein
MMDAVDVERRPAVGATHPGRDLDAEDVPPLECLVAELPDAHQRGMFLRELFISDA